MKRYEHLIRLTLTINGEPTTIRCDAGDTLLHALRNGAGLTGTKLGCENGDCGACTILVDGKPVKSCYTLAVDVDDCELTTIEGLRDTAVQRGFAQEYGFQCGYCTPGFIVNAFALLTEHPDPDVNTTREWLESNLCRCTGYETIENAIRSASGSSAWRGGGGSSSGSSSSSSGGVPQPARGLGES